uniref:hypothetical protein n=1 Tax=Paenibacillus albidus TaxID=2041023 RepID=UPI001E3B9548|nr:hypothetical protein [Paenibacillus albidus]
MKTVGQNKLIFGSDLYIITRFELTITHVVFLHPHEGPIRVGLAEAIPVAKQHLVLLVFQQSGQQILTEPLNGFFQWFVLGLVQQLRL